MDYLKLMRVKHYVKNLLIFVPVFFSKKIFDLSMISQVCIGFVCFSLISSAVYILNDIRDVEKDRKHPKKKNRPIASGKINKLQAVFLMIMCILIPMTTGLFFLREGIIFLILYLFLNMAYSMGLKNYPIIDVVLLTAGFVIRVLYGGVIANVEVSEWLYLVIVSGALYMGFGKRRNELKQQKNTRKVLKHYNDAFLDKNMYVAVALVIVFYSMWAIESINPLMIWTVPFFMIILMKYSFDVEGNSDGDPVEVILQDKVLILLILLYAICVFILLYFF